MPDLLGEVINTEYNTIKVISVHGEQIYNVRNRRGPRNTQSQNDRTLSKRYRTAMENKTIDKIGVGKNAGQVTQLELRVSNNGYDVYSDGVFIGRTVETSFSKLWTVEIPGFSNPIYFAGNSTYAADLLDTFYKLKS